MSNELQDLYQEMILDHSRHPHNFRRMKDADRTMEGFNPLCGDDLTLYLRLEGDRITDVSFHGRGCALSMASASMLTDMVRGRSIREAIGLFDAVRELLTDEHPQPGAPALGELQALSGVRKYPMRVKCASLSWHALRAALQEQPPESVTTE
jgi:nitrogen fixation NifU-like protein